MAVSSNEERSSTEKNREVKNNGSNGGKSIGMKNNEQEGACLLGKDDWTYKHIPLSEVPARISKGGKSRNPTCLAILKTAGDGPKGPKT